MVAMAGNNAWSNHRLLSACEALTPEEFAAPRTSFFPSLRATCNHILAVDCYYIDALAGLDALRHYSQPDPDFADARAMRLAQTASDKRLIALCESQTEESLARECVLPRPNRKPPPTAVAAVLEHLFQHQIHHRGQAHAMLAGTRVARPSSTSSSSPAKRSCAATNSGRSDCQSDDAAALLVRRRRDRGERSWPLHRVPPALAADAGVSSRLGPARIGCCGPAATIISSCARPRRA
jgi:uncharacterized damage-inducible protein DinB